jgi:hypothetical protein
MPRGITIRRWLFRLLKLPPRLVYAIGLGAQLAQKLGQEGKPFAPGLLDSTTTKTDLKNLSKLLRPEAEKIKKAAKKGHSDGDDQED